MKILANMSTFLLFSHSTHEVVRCTHCLTPWPAPPLFFLLNIDILAIFSYQYIKYFLPPPPLFNTMWSHQVALVVKNPPVNPPAGDVGDAGSIPGPGRSLGKEMATPSHG